MTQQSFQTEQERLIGSIKQARETHRPTGAQQQKLRDLVHRQLKSEVRAMRKSKRTAA